MRKSIESDLVDSNVNFKTDVDLSSISWCKHGGMTEILILPRCESEIIAAIEILDKNQASYQIIGSTSNIIFFNEDSFPVLISTLSHVGYVWTTPEEIFVRSGTLTHDFVRYSLTFERAGLEGLEGIPGTIGGAIAQNAGAYGYNISDHLVSVKVYDKRNAKVIELPRNKCNFQHRTSLFKNNLYVILGGTFRPPKTNVRSAERLIERFHIARHAYQDFTAPNLGSLFAVNHDFYRELCGQSKIKLYTLNALKVCVQNPLIKFLMRKKPSRAPLNWWVRFFLNLKLDKRFISHKSLNILMFRERYSKQQILEHIRTIKDYAPNLILENEILSPPELSDRYDTEQRKKLALISFVGVDSYGANLQLFAAYKILGRKFDVIIPNWRSVGIENKVKSIRIRFTLRGIIRFFFDLLFFSQTKKRLESFKHFLHKNCNLSHPLDYEQFHNLLNSCDGVIVGSDQTLNEALTNPGGEGYFSFPKSVKKAICMASSFGEIDERRLNVDSLLIRRFKSYQLLSFREQKSVDFINRNFKLNAQFLPDPVFGLSSKDWVRLAKSLGGTSLAESNTVGIFSLTKTNLCLNLKKINFPSEPCVIVNQMQPIFLQKKIERTISIAEFILTIHAAKVVITDSFHGVSMCLILNTPFIAIEPSHAPNRVVDLLERVNQEFRLFSGNIANKIENEKILELPNCQRILNQYRDLHREFCSELTDII